MTTLAQFLRELRVTSARTADPRVAVELVRPLVVDLARSRSWVEPRLYECDPEQGFGAHLLHEEPDHTLAVFAGAWLPGRGAPPHNHGTWALVAGVDGEERNTFWTRTDDGTRPGQARIRRLEDRVLGPGEVITFRPDTIHSVINETSRVSLSLHVYGVHVNHANRSQFDPESHTESRFILKID